MSDIPHTFNTFQNKDDVLIRNILIGTLHSMRDRISWDNTVNSENDKVDVPIYFTVAGSERFLSDIFLNQYKIETETIAETVYNKYPRAHVSMEGISIQEEFLTNKFTRANHLKQTPDGELIQYNAEFQDIPLKIDMSVKVHLDSIIDIFKCWSSIMQNLYSNVHYYVDSNGIKVPCYFKIPDSINKERPLDFGFSDKKEITVTFDIEVQASYPLFKDETSIFAGDRMENILYTVETIPTYSTPSRQPSEESGDSGETKNTRGLTYKVSRDTWPSGNNKGNFYPEPEE